MHQLGMLAAELLQDTGLVLPESQVDLFPVVFVVGKGHIDFRQREPRIGGSGGAST